MNDIWKQIWEMKAPHIGVFLVLLAVITLTLLLKDRVSKRRGTADLIRYPVLVVSFLYVGLFLKAQPTVMNVVVFFNNLKEGSFPLFTLYMLDPFIFLSFLFIGVTMFLWGRGAFCGWLCPYGAMLEILNRLYRKLPFAREVTVPYGLHWKLVYVKYLVFLIILGVSFFSFHLAEFLGEVEPFKTFILKLNRELPFVLYFLLLTVASVVVYRAFCRYLCPLGGAIALPSLILSRWFPLMKIKRYELCRKCVICSVTCQPKAIRRDGTIDRRECLLCLECHENFWDEDLCPVLIRKRRGQFRRSGLVLVGVLLLMFSAPSFGGVIQVGEGGTFRSIREALKSAREGDTILIRGGVYEENLLIEKRVHIKGVGEPVILWEGTDNPFIPSDRGYMIGIKADGVLIEGVVLKHKKSKGKRTLGIVVERSRNVVLRDLKIIGTSIGVKAVESEGLVIENSYIEGEKELEVNRRGNCIDLTGSHRAVIRNNTLRFCKDGIYMEVSHEGLVENNRIEDSRYSIHTMWVDRGVWRKNFVRNNLLGLAIMYTKRAVIEENLSVGNTTHGILLIQAERSRIRNNVVIGNSCGIYFFGSYKNDLTGNLVMNHLIGVWTLAASEKNRIEGNSFINNGIQVRFVSTKREEVWRGNYWSDYIGWDMDGDGVGDIPYETGSYVDMILWKYPLSKFLFTSPALQTITFIERQFPVFEASKVVDPEPLMRPPHENWRELAKRFNVKPSLYYGDLEKFQVVH
jgi:nitrous oxidase accessory protein